MRPSRRGESNGDDSNAQNSPGFFTTIDLGPEVKLSTDASKKPKWLNITFSREGKDTTVNAIYELTGDELKISMPRAPKKGSGVAFENKRPQGFDTKDKPEMVLKAKRAK